MASRRLEKLRGPIGDMSADTGAYCQARLRPPTRTNFRSVSQDFPRSSSRWHVTCLNGNPLTTADESHAPF